MSFTLRTKDKAIRSQSLFKAQIKSFSSLSDSAGTLTATPGKLSHLLLEIIPPSTTRVTTSFPLTSNT